MNTDLLRNEILCALDTFIQDDVLQFVSNTLDIVLNNYDISAKTYDIVPYNYADEVLKTFIVIKKIEGASIKSLENYNNALQKLFNYYRKPVDKITANDIRVYLYKYQEERKVCNRTLDAMRSIFSSFFGWAAIEGYIPDNPCKIVKPIKYERRERQPLTQLELEQIRDACKTVRERAIIETFYSTGCRVSELGALNKSDVNFETKEVHLFGKGSKHRTSYLNAKAEVWIKKYLLSRTDGNESLFVSDRKPHGRLHKDGIEAIVKKILKRSKLDINVTPHVFRHTTATTSVANGMPIEEVSKLLGHENISTTMIYAKVSATNVKHNHLKCVI